MKFWQFKDSSMYIFNHLSDVNFVYNRCITFDLNTPNYWGGGVKPNGSLL